MAAENFPPYTQHISEEVLKRVTWYYKIVKIISRHFPVKIDYSFLKSQYIFKMMLLCLQPVFTNR